MLLLNESLLRHVLKKLEKRGIIPVHIEKGTRLGLDPELRPRNYLKDLFQCSYTARQRDKGVRKLRHLELPFVHGFHAMQFGQSVVSKFPDHPSLRDHADHFAVGGKRAVGT